MKRSDSERGMIVELHRAGWKPYAIFKKFKKFRKQFVYNTIKRYREHQTIKDQPRLGRPCSVRTKKLVNNVKKSVSRNACRSQRKLAAHYQTSRSTIRRVLQDDLGVRPYKPQKVQQLRDVDKQRRLARCKQLLNRFRGSELSTIMFSDEKVFQLGSLPPSQNARIHAQSRS